MSCRQFITVIDLIADHALTVQLTELDITACMNISVDTAALQSLMTDYIPIDGAVCTEMTEDLDTEILRSVVAVVRKGDLDWRRITIGLFCDADDLFAAQLNDADHTIVFQIGCEVWINSGIFRK